MDNSQKITRIRDAAVGDKLGQKDAEAPDVALDAEPAVVGGLRRGPLDGEPGPDPGLVLVLLDQPRQAKVSYLHIVVIANKAVSKKRGKVGLASTIGLMGRGLYTFTTLNSSLDKVVGLILAPHGSPPPL